MAVPWPEIAAHRERLVRLARRRVPTREDAEDVASEAMLRCATFDDLDPARLAQFLTAVTLRLCADVYREADKGTRLVRRLDVDDEPSPEELACAAADAGILRDLLYRLPDSQRAVLVDRAHGLSVTQISHRHSLTYKAVESALSRARATMRNALAGAMALVFAAAEALRRKPGVEAVLPAASVAFVTAVVAPFIGGPVDGGAPARAAQRPPAVRLEGVPRGTGLVAAAAPAVAPARAPEAARPRPEPKPKPKPKPKPTPTPSEIPNPFDPDEPIARDRDGEIITRDQIEACFEDGPSVRLTPEGTWNGLERYRADVDCAGGQ